MDWLDHEIGQVSDRLKWLRKLKKASDGGKRF